MSLGSSGRLPGMTTTSSTFTGISTVAIPVRDQDRTVALFERLGFRVRFDADVAEGFRWIEVAATDGGTSLAIIASGDYLPTGIDTGIRLVTPVARAAHAELVALGLDV